MENNKYRYKFSVVIPIYNVENYLEETIKSVLNQSIGFDENIQLILVNDGSTDKSEDICLHYKEEYPAIKNESLYVLNTKDKETIEELSDILAKPMLIVYNMENSSEGNKLTDSMMSKMMDPNNMAAGQANIDRSQMAKFMDEDGNFDMFAYINAMPKDAKEDMLSQMFPISSP